MEAGIHSDNSLRGNPPAALKAGDGQPAVAGGLGDPPDDGSAPGGGTVRRPREQPSTLPGTAGVISARTRQRRTRSSGESAHRTPPGSATSPPQTSIPERAPNALKATKEAGRLFHLASQTPEQPNVNARRAPRVYSPTGDRATSRAPAAA
ncbi:uncharacterized protein LOC126456614 [Schistocerca serialis cubense]|uniref:uncharacterized protein LOC126456614 n=1 Tax=Schistocerca serialis cubense TaxID=2023355 RepID=UPI00214E058A|nr:uncharacterized protein LOC126456614 [Schistocerca serialis cubense]